MRKLLSTLTWLALLTKMPTAHKFRTVQLATRTALDPNRISLTLFPPTVVFSVSVVVSSAPASNKETPWGIFVIPVPGLPMCSASPVRGRIGAGSPKNHITEYRSLTCRCCNTVEWHGLAFISAVRSIGINIQCRRDTLKKVVARQSNLRGGTPLTDPKTAWPGPINIVHHFIGECLQGARALSLIPGFKYWLGFGSERNFS